MTTPYIALNAHSYFSFLTGLPSPAGLAAAAAALEMPALALTDRQSLTGAVEFTLACRKVGVQPVLGVEIGLEGALGHSLPLVLLGEGESSWSCLCRLVSRLNLRANPEAPCPLDLLAGCATGLLALCPPETAVQALPGPLLDLFPARLYVLVADPLRDRPALEAARRAGVPAAAGAPVYYLQPEQAALQRTLSAIRLNTTLAALPVEAAAPRGAYLAGPAEMQNRFRDMPAALALTAEIAARCRGAVALGRPLYPKVPLPPGKTASQVLREKAERGVRERYSIVTPAIRDRLEHELSVISARGYEPVFLISEEILAYARESGVPFSSRGSAASSLVAHCLGITSPDPLALDLYFERFLNPARTSPPDIDTDLCSRRRDSVLQHVFDTYGAGQVAMVGTINRFRARSALGDAAKAHGLPPAKARELAGALPYAFFARMEEEGEAGLPSPFADLRTAYPAYHKILDDAEALLKIPRHLSVHAGGLIVGPGPLEELVPLARSGSKGIIITQMDLDSVGALGLVKIDLLGIRGLTVLGDVAAAVHSWQRREYRRPLDVLEAVPDDDPRTADRVERGETIGCFQIESPGMRATLRDIRARSPADIIAALALYRPGPLQGGLRDAFVRRFKGEEPVEHLHPSLRPLLESTYGVILYQEQVLRIAHEVAGLSLADADLLRRAMSHFDPGREMARLKERFVFGALEHSKIPPDTGEHLWELMAAFAGYGFPKAHAASYAQVAWRSAWCKTHFPAEFMAAVMANWGGYYSQRVYLSEVRRLGLRVLAPHVNHARREFSVSYPGGQPQLYMGLDQVRDLTGRTIDRLLRLRPFTGFEDFLSRVDPRCQEVENLVRIGAFEGLGTIPALLRRLESGWRAGQMSLFDVPDESEDWGVAERAAAQQELLGISVDVHPLELHLAAVARSGAVTTAEAAARIGVHVTVAGIRQSSHRSRTAKGGVMLFMTLEDLDGMLDVVVFPDLYHRVRAAVSSGSPLLITGIVEMDDRRGEPLLHAERVSLLA